MSSRLFKTTLTAVLATGLLISAFVLAAPALAATWGSSATGGIQGDFNHPASVTCMATLNARLYVGTGERCEVWEYHPSGTPTWNQVNADGFGVTGNTGVSSLCVYDSGAGPKLYAGTSNSTYGCQVWRYDGGSVWTQVNSSGFQGTNPQENTSVASMVVVNLLGINKLYAGTENSNPAEGCQVWSYNGTSWSNPVGPAANLGHQTASGFGDTFNRSATAMTVYDEGGSPKLLVGTHNKNTGGQVWRWDGNPTPEPPPVWYQVNTSGFGDGSFNVEVSSMTEFDIGATRYLYCGTLRSDNTGCKVYRATFNAPLPLPAWTVETPSPGFGSIQDTEASSMVVYEDNLYVGTSGTGSEGKVEEYNPAPAPAWAQVNEDNFGYPPDRGVPALVMYDPGSGETVFAGTDGGGSLNGQGQVRQWTGGTTWNLVNRTGFVGNANTKVTCMANAGGKAYAGTGSEIGCEVWRRDGGLWTQIVGQDPAGTQPTGPGFGDYRNGTAQAMAAYNDGTGEKLYVGTSACQVWEYNPATGALRQVNTNGFGVVDNNSAFSMAVYNSALYVGTENRVNGCQVWRWSGGGAGDWTQVGLNGLGNSHNMTPMCMTVMGPSLYVGTLYKDPGPPLNITCEVLRYTGTPYSWDLVNVPGFGTTDDSSVSCMAPYNDGTGTKLYAGTMKREVWRYSGAGTAWTQLPVFPDATTGVYSMTSYYGDLMVGAGSSVGCFVYSWDGSSWTLENTPGFGNVNNDQPTSMLVKGPQLLVGTQNWNQGAQIWETTGPYIASATPPSSSQGTTLNVDIVGSGTAFGAGTTASFSGSGITVNSTSVVDAANATANITIAADATLGARDVAVTTPGEPQTPVPLSGGFTVTAPPAPPVPANATWYLAEGTSAWGFKTYITIENPNDRQCTASVTYNTNDGARQAPDVPLPPMSQTTLNPQDVVPNQDFSTVVSCREGLTIAVDRTMTWTGKNAPSEEGHNSTGVTSPAPAWYLPEGSTAWGFECWLLIQNPNPADTTCHVTYMIEGEGPRTIDHVVPANSRKTFDVSKDIGAKDASIKVDADQPVIPERAMYRYDRREGHDSIGTTAPASDFFLAEGTTAWGFTTYVLVQNPQNSPTDVILTYMTPGGPRTQPVFTMPANSRKTVRVNDVKPANGYPIDVSNTDLSTQVHGTQPIIAERAMYWGAGTPLGEACHDSIGMDSPHTCFYLPDGATSNGRETWTLVQNSNPADVTVEISYLTPTGAGDVVFQDTIPAQSRKTYNMVDKGISGRAGVMVRSLDPAKKIMVERAMYWNSRGAGTDTIGGYSD
jgi:hypothetical protein